MRYALKGILFLLFGLSAFSVPASAGPILWTLSGITLQDGATATGSFDFDADTGLFSNILVTIAGGTLSPSLQGTYTFADPGGAGFEAIALLLDAPVPDNTGNPAFALIVPPPGMTDAGGTDLTNVGGVGTCDNPGCANITLAVNGSVLSNSDHHPMITANAVPEPATSVTILLAFIGMAWHQSRNRQKRG
jgi:hypothetical protein